MKKAVWSTLIALLTVISLNAQKIGGDNDNPELELVPKHIIKVSPLDALFGGILIGYERVISPKMSLDFELFQGFRKQNFVNSVSERSYNLFFDAELRYYLSKRKKALEGWFVSGGLLTQYRYDKLRHKNTGQITDFERLRVGGAVKTGYQWIFKKALKGFTTEVGGGVDYRTTTGILDGGNFNDLNINVNFVIGYSW